MFEVLAKGFAKNADEAVVKTWFFEEGDEVEEGDELAELVADDVSVLVTAPVSGVLTEVCVDEDEAVGRDELLCIIDDEEIKIGDDADEDA